MYGNSCVHIKSDALSATTAWKYKQRKKIGLVASWLTEHLHSTLITYDRIIRVHHYTLNPKIRVFYWKPASRNMGWRLMATWINRTALQYFTFPHGFQWILAESHGNSMEIPVDSHGFQVEFLWNLGGIFMESRWNFYGFRVEFPCTYYIYWQNYLCESCDFKYRWIRWHWLPCLSGSVLHNYDHAIQTLTSKVINVIWSTYT